MDTKLTDPIAAAESLDALCVALNTLGTDQVIALGYNGSDYPTYSDHDVQDTQDVWSWDATRILVHDSGGWGLEPRCAVCGEARFHCEHDNQMEITAGGDLVALTEQAGKQAGNGGFEMTMNEIRETMHYRNHDSRLGGCVTCTGREILDLIAEWDRDGQLDGDEVWDIEQVTDTDLVQLDD